MSAIGENFRVFRDGIKVLEPMSMETENAGKLCSLLILSFTKTADQ